MKTLEVVNGKIFDCDREVPVGGKVYVGFEFHLEAEVRQTPKTGLHFAVFAPGHHGPHFEYAVKVTGDGTYKLQKYGGYRVVPIVEVKDPVRRYVRLAGIPAACIQRLKAGEALDLTEEDADHWHGSYSTSVEVKTDGNKSYGEPSLRKKAPWGSQASDEYDRPVTITGASWAIQDRFSPDGASYKHTYTVYVWSGVDAVKLADALAHAALGKEADHTALDAKLAELVSARS